MAFKGFFGLDILKYRINQIMFVRGENAGLIPKETIDSIYKTMSAQFILRITSLSLCGTCVYLLPLQIEPIFILPSKLMIMAFSHRTLTFKGQKDLFNQLQACCEDNGLLDKVNLMELDETDNRVLKKWLDREQNKEN